MERADEAPRGAEGATGGRQDEETPALSGAGDSVFGPLAIGAYGAAYVLNRVTAATQRNRHSLCADVGEHTEHDSHSNAYNLYHALPIDPAVFSPDNIAPFPHSSPSQPDDHSHHSQHQQPHPHPGMPMFPAPIFHQPQPVHFSDSNVASTVQPLSVSATSASASHTQQPLQGTVVHKPTPFQPPVQPISDRRDKHSNQPDVISSHQPVIFHAPMVSSSHLPTLAQYKANPHSARLLIGSPHVREPNGEPISR
jgi:hypothetical protein